MKWDILDFLSKIQDHMTLENDLRAPTNLYK